MRKTTLFFIMLVLSTLSVSCLNSNKNNTLDIALEGVKPALSYLDKHYGVLEDLFASIKAYINDTSEENLIAAQKACSLAVVELKSIEIPSLPLDEDELSLVQNIGINIGDYSSLYTLLKDYTNESIFEINNLKYYLDIAPFGNEMLAKSIEFDTFQLYVMKRVDLYGINYMFADFSEEGLKDFITEFLPTLTVLCDNMPAWEFDKEIIEKKAEFLMDELEILLMEYVEFSNEMANEVLNLERDFITSLFENDISRSEVEKIIENMNFKINVTSYLEELYEKQ